MKALCMTSRNIVYETDVKNSFLYLGVYECIVNAKEC